MPASRQRATPAAVGAGQLAACVLAACIVASCGDATGSPIRSLEKADAGTPDAGDAPDAMSSATLLPPGALPSMGMSGSGSNDGPGSMRDGHPNADVPLTRPCLSVAANWPQQQAEEDMRQAILDQRNMPGGVRCGDRGSDRLPSLSFPRELRCSARLHSYDMAVQGYRGTLAPDGSDPGDRMTAAGFAHGKTAESIVVGSGSVPEVLYALLGDREGCANLANREFTSLGIGAYAGLWTFDFAADP